MTALVWDQVGQRFYEGGISKGVLYQINGYGVAWNGLTGLEETITTEIQAVHYDGVKFNDLVTMGDFTATLKAFTYPDEFLPYEGIQQDQSGFYVTAQPPVQFGLCYRTEVADDIVGFESGYKIHVLYNLTALPSQKAYLSLSDESEPMEFEWTITAIPEDIENFRPTAHIIFDSRKIDPLLLEDIEDILYGSEEHDAYLPPLQGFATFIRKWDRLIITDHGDGSWTAESEVEGQITMLDDTTFQIISDTAVYLDPDTYTITSSDKNEEDIIWPPLPA